MNMCYITLDGDARGNIPTYANAVLIPSSVESVKRTRAFVIIVALDPASDDVGCDAAKAATDRQVRRISIGKPAIYLDADYFGSDLPSAVVVGAREPVEVASIVFSEVSTECRCFNGGFSRCSHTPEGPNVVAPA